MSLLFMNTLGEAWFVWTCDRATCM